MKAVQWIGGALLLACCVTLQFDRTAFFAAWLTAWWFCLGITLGALANRYLHCITGGRWGDVLHSAFDLVASRASWLIVLYLPLLFGLSVLYPWARDPNWASQLARPEFKHLWLSAPFFTIRALAYLLVWWTIARLSQRRVLKTGQAAAALIVYGFVLSIAAVDGLASLMPQWHSSAFGLLIAISQMLAGMAFVIVLTFLRSPYTNDHVGTHDKNTPPVSRDLGNLLLMYIMMWAYIAFTQFQIIWAENLPDEISWYVPRLQINWVWVGWALILLKFFAPLVLLLFRDIKDKPQRLAWIAAGLLVMSAVDLVWTIVPSVASHDMTAAAVALLATAGMGALLFGDMLPVASRKIPTVPAGRARHA